MNQIDVRLTQEEVALANFVAKQRDDAGVKAKANNAKHGNKAPSDVRHGQGTHAEIAVASAVDRYWTGMGTTWHDDEDVGNIQVRGTEWKNGRLLIRKSDAASKKIDLPWVLTIRRGPFEHRLVGWIIGRIGLRPEFIDAPAGRPPCWMVPQGFLRVDFESMALRHPIAELSEREHEVARFVARTMHRDLSIVLQEMQAAKRTNTYWDCSGHRKGQVHRDGAYA